MAGKRYGSGTPESQALDAPMDFEVAGLRYDDEEIHSFRAIRKVDTLLAAKFTNLGEEDAGRMLQIITRLIGKTLDNKDGTPIQWVVNVLPKPKDAGGDWEPKFRGPDGELHPMSAADKFLDPAAGSSRRRWEALVNDDDFTVQLEALAEVAKDLIAESAGRPTPGS